jgi:predicted outer membrane repeat protein
VKTSKRARTVITAFLLSSAAWIGGSNLVAADEVAQPGPTFTVNTIDEHDDGVCGEDDCTLHEAIIVANADSDLNEIVFANGLAGTITTDKLSPGNGIPITKPVTITGPGARLLTISGNHTSRAFFVLMGDVEISGLSFSNCDSGDGGAIHTLSGLTITDCIFSGNTSDGQGGALDGEPGSSIVLTGCAFSDNTAKNGGGAVSGGTNLAATNCTFFNNSAGFGGAIHDSGGPALLMNCTITGNHATDSVAAAGGVDGAPGVQLGGCIVAGNTAGDLTTPDLFGFLTSAGYNLIGASSGNNGFSDGVNHDHVGTTTAPLDPGLDPAGLQSNGGPTDTIALLPESLAIDAGDPMNAPERDQRDYDRVNAPDIGAFEFGGTIPRTLANISTRLLVETGDNVLIGGFIVTGTHPKQVLLRAIGASLSLDGRLANPVLELRDSTGALIASNDNWQTNSNKQEIIDTGIPPNDPLESALLMALDPGAYTAIVTGANNGTGIGLIEAYDLDRTTDSKLANISTRGFVQIGDKVMIGGFIVLGSEEQDVLVRAIGPSLPVSNALADPVLELHDSNGATLAVNNNWRDTQENEIEATGIPPIEDAESAILSTLSPGGYTVIVRGAGDTTGVALVESYGLN